MLRLFKIRGFAAYLTIAFLNAFTDLGHKIIIQNTVFKFYDGSTQVVLTLLVNACIVLPFVLFFTPTGFLADKFPKDRIIKVAAALAIPLTAAITLAYYMGWFEVAFVCTLLLGTQAAFYSPAKYGYIKELTGKEHLATANAYVQAVTIVSILGGTLVFSALFESLLPANVSTVADTLRSIAPLGWLLVGFSVVEFLFALRLQPKRDTDTTMHFDVRKYARLDYLRSNLGSVRRSQVIWLSIVGISVYWGINQVVLASFPAYMKDTLDVHNTTIANGLMALAGVGIIIGSLIAGKASEEFIETGIVPLGALGLTAALFILPTVHHLWVLGGLFLFYGVMGGLFIIPLNALIQFNASSDEAGTVLAANNFMQNLLMSSFLALTALATTVWKFDTRIILYTMASAAAIGSIYALSKLPQAFVRYVVAVLTSQRYTLHVIGLRNIPSTGGALLLANHTSWFDWAILQVACPRPVRFVMARRIYEHPVLKPVLDIFGVIPIAPGKGSDESLTLVREALLPGEVVAIFPEGRISLNGQLAEFKRGFERAVQGTGANVVPVYLRGLWGTAFSYATTRLRRSTLERGKRSITVAFGERLPDGITAPEVKQHITTLSIATWRTYANSLRPLHEQWIRTAKANASNIALVDGRQRLTHVGLLSKTLAFSSALEIALKKSLAHTPSTTTPARVGVLLPAGAEAAMAVMALWMHGAVPVLIDYSGSSSDLVRSMELAGVEIIITTHTFQHELSEQFSEASSILASKTIFFTDELHHAAAEPRTRPSPSQQLHKLWRPLWLSLAPVWLLRAIHFRSGTASGTASGASSSTASANSPAHSPAVVLFAGSGDTLRPVELTHTHIACTIKQISHVLNAQENDVMLTALPNCTAFGFIVGMLVPLTNGFATVTAEAATKITEGFDAAALGKLAARNDATLLIAEPSQIRDCTTNDALHPLMFQSLRLVITGTNGFTERCDEATKAAYKQKFGGTVYEGFGTTETIPVASVNVPDALNTGDWKVQAGTKPASVGLPLPGCAFKIVDERTRDEKPLGEQGLLMIGTPYQQNEHNQRNEATPHTAENNTAEDITWLLTAVRGSLDTEGFLTLA
jgi:acyl-[acyl-carrier-protein]-phospholipid O-acyltransferase/long-chain-fatty-acid--[acyl-carrier-protein] ligase